MFQRPEKNLVIAFTKTRMVQNTYGEEEIIPVAKGENGE